MKTLILLLLCCGLATMSAAQCPTSDIILDSQAAIDNFSTNYPGCTMIPAGVNVTIDDASVLGNITNVDGLSQLTSVGGDFSIRNNLALMNVDGLNQITSIGGNLEFLYNSVLMNVDGLSQLISIGGNLSILDDYALTNLSGLSQLASVGGALQIEDNSVLMNVDGLSQLSSTGGPLWIENNAALTNIDGFSQITSVGGLLVVYNNLQLNQCCALCPLLAADAADPTVIGGEITIEFNLTGCNSVAEINACSPCGLVDTSSPEYAPAQLSIYPNPAQEILHFEYESSKDELIHFTIKNYLGQQFIQGQVYTKQSIPVDISGYPAGLYVLNVQEGDTTRSRFFSVSR